MTSLVNQGEVFHLIYHSLRNVINYQRTKGIVGARFPWPNVFSMASDVTSIGVK
jgi:hypothetical protein